MNESETRAELIDPALKAAGWGVMEGSKILREYGISAGSMHSVVHFSPFQVIDKYQKSV